MKKWYQTNGAIIGFLILFFPVGLFLMWKSDWNKVAKIIVSVFFGIGVIGAFGNNSEQPTSVNNANVVVEEKIIQQEQIEENKKEEEIKPEVEEPDKTTEELEKEYKNSCTNLDYKDVARNPDNYKNKNTVLKGKVIQVSEGLFGSVTLRVATKENEYLGYTDDIYLVTYKQVENNRILEDDMVTIWGLCDGVTTYSSMLGGNITIPSVQMEYYEIH